MPPGRFHDPLHENGARRLHPLCLPAPHGPDRHANGHVIEVFVPQRQPENPLPEQLAKLMLDVGNMPVITEALLQPADHSRPRLGLSENQTTPVTAEVATRKIGRYFTLSKSLKFKCLLGTLCHSEVLYGSCSNSLDHSSLGCGLRYSYVFL